MPGVDVQAIDTADATEDELTGHVLEGPLGGTVEVALDDALDSPAVLDLRAARDDDRLADWLTDLDHRAMGATYDPESPRDHLVSYDYDEAFDGLCWVAETTRARPLSD